MQVRNSVFLLKTKINTYCEPACRNIGSFCVVNVIHGGLDCRVAVPAPRKDDLISVHLSLDWRQAPILHVFASPAFSRERQRGGRRSSLCFCICICICICFCFCLLLL